MGDPEEPDEINGGTVVGIIVANLSCEVGGYVRAHDLGVTMSSRAEYQFVPGDDTLRHPRISFVSYDRLPSRRVPRGPFTFGPDLAIDVVFPDYTAEKMETKLDEYLRAGVRLIWYVYIPTKNVWAYRPDGTAKLYRVTDSLPGEDVLPGFSMPVAQVFEDV